MMNNMNESENESNKEVPNSLNQNSETNLPTTDNSTETNGQRFTLSTGSKAMLKTLFMEHFNSATFAPEDKRALFRIIQKEIPDLTRPALNRLFMAAENTFYSQLPRLPAEAIINKMTLQNEVLKERILEESQMDITSQVNSIVKLDEITAKVNKLSDAPMKVEINFGSSISEDDLLKGVNIIDIKVDEK